MKLPPFFSSVRAPETLEEPAYWYIFKGSRLLVRDEGETASMPRLFAPDELGLTAVRQQYLGYLDDENGKIHCYSAEVDRKLETTPEGHAFKGLRELYPLLGDGFFWLGGRAIQIVDWDRTHQFCGRCGAKTESLAHERSKKCPQCGLTAYPRLAPAIIIAIERPFPDGNRILLARNARFPYGFYSVLAGFVEPGETLEECAHREVFEETGIRIKNVRYFGSQPWPFPHSLMVGFTADYAGGDIVLEEEELDDAAWFRADDMPLTPPSLSISASLIQWFVDKNS
ncbi:MAG: NAD(+) diphosphatase [Chloroflexota bacterium]